LANNLGGKYKRATGIAIITTVANIGGASASNIFRSQDAPRYIFGRKSCRCDSLCPDLKLDNILVGLVIAFIAMGLTVIPLIAFTYKRINSARDREELLQQQKGEKAEPMEGGEAKPIGDRALSFRYTL
jgi:hypothetical protein